MTTPTFRVTASYVDPAGNRGDHVYRACEVIAQSAEEAAVKALIEVKIPAELYPIEGNLWQAAQREVYWSAIRDVSQRSRNPDWLHPILLDGTTLCWGTEDEHQCLSVSVEQITD